MGFFKKVLDDITSDKKKFKIFVSAGLCTFILLLVIFVSLVNGNNNSTVETSKITKKKIVNTENTQKAEALVVEIKPEEEQAQELTEEEQEKVEQEEKEENEKNDSSSAPSGYGTSYYIKVNYGANVVTVYQQDADGNYTVPVRAMICSTGSATPKSGVYKTKSAKHRWGALFGGVWGQYTTQIVGNILFHSVPYLSADASNLEYWEYDKLGTTASAGCVRLKVCDAKWIYENIPAGTPTEFYSDSNPGPLGKPGAQKISGNERCRGWDPTDPNGENPWNNENKVQEQPQQQEVKQEVQPEQTQEQSKEQPKEQPKEQQVEQKQEEIQQETPTEKNENSEKDKEKQEDENGQQTEEQNNPETGEESNQENTEPSEIEEGNKEEQNNLSEEKQ